MTSAQSCPWCGVDPLSQASDRERIEDLTRQVRLLQETVARLRATGVQRPVPASRLPS